jgi:acyl transferase domain-containing protein
MPDKLLDLKKIKLTEISESEKIKVEHISNRDIAIIGMDGRFGSAENPEEFWKALVAGKDFIRPLPEDRKERIISFLKKQASYSDDQRFAENAYMNGIDRFDYNFFNISPREAGLMDPNQRIFLEVVWKAIEDSGYSGQCLRGTKTGIFVGDVGNSFPDYKTMIFLEDIEKYSMSIPGNINSIIASRISYILDLKGPAVAVDTACSSSLIAVHMACQSLMSGECDLAVAGGINIRLMPLKNESPGIGIRAVDERTRAFDDSSGGTGGGEGAAAVILKPLCKALSDGDSIYAVIKGSASNQDGSSIGITAPSSSAQEDVIVAAWRNAGIEPETISYIETHGTGTKLGDPIEIEGISRAFRNFTQKKQFCSISALKTNVGHLDSAAGIAGLVKAVLALKNSQIPPILHIERPNRKIPFEESPVYINDVLTDWNTGDAPRRCGVSSFGLSGTNCHIILEEAPCTPAFEEAVQAPYIFTLSAASMDSFIALVELYISYIECNGEVSIADVCNTANTGRSHHKYRAAILTDNRQDLLQRLGILAHPDTISDMEQGIFFGRHDIVSEHKALKEAYEINNDEKRRMSVDARELIRGLDHSGSNDYRQTLCRLAELYVKGADIEWKQLYRGKRYKRVHLPTYPFIGEQCWFAENSAAAENEPMYHYISWKESELDSQAPSLDKEGDILVLKDSNGLADKLKEELFKENENIIEVSFGAEYVRQGENEFIITGSEDDYKRLLGELSTRKLTWIVHLCSTSIQADTKEVQETEKRLELGVYSIFRLLRAIVGNRIKSQINIMAVTRNIGCITGAQGAIIPENAAMVGLLKVINHEHPGLRCRCFDIGSGQDADCIVKEMRSTSKAVVSAFRENKRYVEYFDKLDVDRLRRSNFPVRDTGAYIITGGTGGLGIEAAGWLAKKNRVHLVLISRGKFPERDNWDAVISEGEHRLGSKIRSIRAIEASGSYVELVSADVTDVEVMSRELEKIRMKHGCINGVIHCAGVAGDGFMFLKDEEKLKKVLHPKIHGTRVIDQLTADDELDFLILYSSVTSIAGAQGQGDYTAANAFLDSFSDYRSTLGRRTLAINWPAWKETGMAVEYGVDMEHSIMKPITTEKALVAMDMLLGSGCTRAVVGQINYRELEKSHDIAGIEFSECILREMKKRTGQQHEQGLNHSARSIVQISISGNQAGSYTDTQRKLAHIWAELLGLREVSIYSSFSELGGDSIFAARMAREMQREFSELVDITDVFSYPTIFELSGYIDGKIDKDSRSKESDIDDVLGKLEKGELSIDEAAALMEMAGEKEWKQ